MGRSCWSWAATTRSSSTETADLKLAIPAIVFGAVGTAGQRCTTTRRLFVHESIYDDVLASWSRPTSRSKGKIGDPTDPANLMGPLNSRGAVQPSWPPSKRPRPAAARSRPAAPRDRPQGQLRAADHHHRPEERRRGGAAETFAPILYVMKYETLDEAIEMQNAVPQGLSSSIFTTEPEGGRAVPVGGRLATAASPTSTSAPRAPRSAAPSAARRRPAAAASRARTRGRSTCAARPTPSTTPTRCRWRRASSSTCNSFPSLLCKEQHP
jgi:hypothetical protein